MNSQFAVFVFLDNPTTSAEHHVVVQYEALTTDLFLSGANSWQRAPAFLTAGLSGPLGGPGLSISAGANGCPSPVRVLVCTTSNVDSGVPFFASEVLLSTTMFSGTGVLELSTGAPALLSPDRGYDYYVTVERGEAGPEGLYPSFEITGLTHDNYLATHGASAPVMPRVQPGRFFTAASGRTGVTFGVNESDLPNLGEMFVGLDSPVQQEWGRYFILASKRLRSPAVRLADFGFSVVESRNGQNGVVVRPDWERLAQAFPTPGSALPPPRRRNTLIKRGNTTFIPGRAGHPGHPGWPGSPARTISVTEEVCAWGPDHAAMFHQGWSRVWVEGTGGLGGQFMWVPPGLGGWQMPYGIICRPVSRLVRIPEQPTVPPTPAVPAVPSQTLIDFNIGWTGRARSIQTLSGEGRVRFKLSETLSAAIVGLSSSFRPNGFSDISYALRFERGVVYAIDQGGAVTNLGGYAPEQEFEIRRQNGKITYRVEGTILREIPNSGVPLHLDAIMFTAGDNIYDPVLERFTSSHTSLRPLASNAGGMQFFFAPPPPISTAAASLQPLQASGWGLTRQGASGAGSLSRLLVLSRPAERGFSALRALAGLAGNYPYAAASGGLAPLASEGGGGFSTPAYAVSSTFFQLLTGGGSMLSGGLIHGDTALRPLSGLASNRPYGAGVGSIRALSGFGVIKSAQEMRDVVAMDLVVAESAVATFSELAVVFDSLGRATGVLSYTSVVGAEAMSTGAASAEYALNALLSATLTSTVSAHSLEATSEEKNSVWVVNTSTAATSRYEDFDFNSFAQINGRYYGAKQGGIFALDGETDNGVGIQAAVSLGKHSFASKTRSHLMRLENCYMGVASDGRLVLKVSAEGKEYLYRTRASSRELQTQRVDVGRGIRANFMEFEIWNENGDDFDLQTIEFAAVVLSRRI